MAFVYRLHPTIGFARVGNSEEFILAPETMAGLTVPGNPAIVGGLPIRPDTESDFIMSADLRDDALALKRHAARFRIFRYPAVEKETYPNGNGEEVQIGTEIDGKKIQDIIWTVHIANKKANAFVLVEDEKAPQGIAGYVPPLLPPIRNWPTSAPNANAPQPDDEIAALNDPERVKLFTIDPGPRTVSGRNARPVRFDRATVASFYDADKRAVTELPAYPKSFPADSFPDMDLPSGPIETLGEIRTDRLGRLLVTGGYGRAAGWKINGVTPPLDQNVNNDRWFDDVSDGPVSAVLVFDDGSIAEVHGAWVTTTDPSFAPQILNIVSLWDDIYDSWVRKLDLAPQIFNGAFQSDYKPFFDDQIAPILRAAGLQQWTTNLDPKGRAAHDAIAQVTADDDPTSAPHAAILPILRNPNNDQFGDVHLMPLHLGDANQSMLALRETQYFFLEQWNRGASHFAKGPGALLGPGELLDKATLVNCLGGRFTPGIDLTFLVREPSIYIQDWQVSGSGPFRIRRKRLDYNLIDGRPCLTAGYIPRHADRDGLEPGDLSKFMAIPWHTDYNSCATHPISPNPKGIKTLFWSWPAQRPVAVFAAADLRMGIDRLSQEPVLELGEQRWSVRGPGTKSAQPQNWGRYQPPIRQILENWYRVGTVMQSTAIETSAGTTIGNPKWFLETGSTLVDIGHERVEPFPNRESSLDERDIFFQLMSDKEPDEETLREARAFVDYWLTWSEKFSNNPKQASDDQLFFEYTEEAFQDRLDMIYQEMVDDADASDPADHPVFKTREDMITRTIQFAPFNLIDGAWLRSIGKTGPIDEARSLVYSILMDELGDGDISKNHCNIYLDLCHSLGYYPPPVNSREFAYDSQFLQSAFTQPAFQLAISELGDDYYPEILGMTVYLEWEVVDLKPTRDLLEYFGINPHFYVMHIGIDNAVNGHGQRAMDAVKIYLQNVRAVGGEPAVQREWRRIWNGFVAFGNIGTFAEDLNELIWNKPSYEKQMLEMIRRKAKYGSSNHQEHRIGPTPINEWFADPPGFLKALVEHDWITAGDWENSRIKQLMDFETGPMFRVFTDDEIQLWADYTNSLNKASPSLPPAISPELAMAAVINQLRLVQWGTPGHQVNTMADVNGEAHPIAWWFGQPTTSIMEALCRPANGLTSPGNPAASRFVMDLISPTGPMGSVFSLAAKAPATGSCREVVVKWIESGCPLLATTNRSLRLNSRPSRRRGHPSGKIFGMGAIH